MILIGLGIAAFVALRVYRAAMARDPEGTRAKVDVLFQGVELVRTLAVFVTSFFCVLRGNFRPVGQAVQLRQGTTRLSFGGQTASDDE